MKSFLSCINNLNSIEEIERHHLSKSRAMGIKLDRQHRFNLYKLGGFSLLTAAGLLISPTAAQAAPVDLQFSGATCVTSVGTACLGVGSVWRFDNVVVGGSAGTQRDALVTISNSTNGASISTIDADVAPTTNSPGTTVAKFQPVIISPTAANSSSYITFNIRFIASGAAITAPSISIGGEVYITPFDVDGDDVTLREMVEFTNPSSTYLDTPTSLESETPAFSPPGTRYIAKTATVQSGIGTSNLYKATALYPANTTNFNLILGSKNGASGCSGASCDRQTSVSFQVSDIVPINDLAIAKSHTGNFTVGLPASYTITTSNIGAASSGSIVIQDPLPTGLTIPNGAVTITGTNAAAWSCIALTNVITCTSTTSIPAQGSSTFNITGIAVGVAATPSVTNTATITTGGGSVTANDIASDTTTVQSSISGTVFNDTNGGTVDGTGTNTGSTTLTAYLVSTASTPLTVAKATVGTNGTYNFSPITAGSYTVRLSNNATGALNAAPPAASLPAGYINTGEGVGVTPTATDGDINGTTAITFGTTSITNVNFGIALRPSLTVTKSTSTPSIAAGGAATYTIEVTNTGSNTANDVAIKDVLPLGFTYDSTIGSISLLNGASRTSGVNPSLGAKQPTWDNFTLPPTGQVIITFTANTAGLVARTYQNPAQAQVGTGSSPTVLASYNSSSSTAEDVTLTAPILTPPTPGTSPPPTVSAATVCGKPGQDGVGSVNGIINTYYAPTATSAPAGTNSIDLGPSLGSGNQINQGDLVVIIQMQDATIDSSDTNLYGSGSSSNLGSGQKDMGASGLYEYAIATSNVPTTGGTLTLLGKGLNNGLINSYTNASKTPTRGQRRFQVIRIPQYASVTLTNTLSSLKWNGAVGGVVVVDVVGQLNFDSRTIDGANGGFRAGYSTVHASNDSTAAYRAPTTSYIGSGKGEGTAGTPRLVWNGTTPVDNGADGYPNGDTGRGAPANAGGGGNVHNAGGGGGGNGGIGGQGALPWEGQNGPFDGGGRPGLQSSIYSPLPWRLIMGGGGGGGDANNVLDGVRGGVGGGIVMIRAGSIAGLGNILVYGDDGDRGAFGNAPDGAGGGGAAGTVLIQARNSSPTANITVQAYGGKGGNTAKDFPPDSATEHGPGGGGGGGVVIYSVPGGAVTTNINGGNSGKSGDGTGTPHGATNGQIGQIGTLGSNDPFIGVNGGGCLPNLTVTKVTTTPKVNRLGLAKYKITVENTALIGSAVDVNIDDPLPTGFSYDSTASIALTSGATRPTATISDPTANAVQPTWGQFTIPPSGKVEINFLAKVGTTVPSGTYNNQAESKYLDPARLSPTGLLTNSYADFAANTGEDVTVNSNAKLLMVKRITAINPASDPTQLPSVNPNDNTALDRFIHNTSTVVGVPINDQNCYWPTATPDAGNTNLCTNTYTIGEVNAGKVKPGDTIEYTVYFVNAGGADANNVKVCDLLRPNQTYVPNSLRLQLGGGSTLSLSDANDPTIDRGQFVASNDLNSSTKTSGCNLAAISATNPNGVVAIDLTGTTGSPTLNPMPGATSAGQPALSYGWFRFRTRVNK